MAINPAQFDAVVDALRRVLPCERPADAVLSAYFRDMRKLGAQDRHLIAETIFAVLRRRAFLTALTAPSATPRRLVIASLIKVRGLNVRELDGILTEAEKKWVVELKAAHPELDLAGRAELPEWVVDALRAGGQDDDAIVALGHSMQNSAPLDLRANTLKMRREDVLAALRAAGLELAPTPFSPVGLRVKGKPPINRHPLFLEGAVEVQDEGSQLLGLLVGARRGEMVVDFCAGAGGKTLAIGATMRSTGRLYAFDVSAHRLDALKPRMARSGLSNIHPAAIAHERDERIKRLAGKIDRVLVDAPCSGLGTLRRNPDLKWRQSAKAVQELVVKQAAILDSAARLLKPGGRLVYATCSILPQENEAIAEAFTAAHPDFLPLDAGEVLGQLKVEQAASLCSGGETGTAYLRMWPHRHQTDGFFAAVWTRKG